MLCGLFPKLAALIQMMPQSVLGGAAVISLPQFVELIFGGSGIVPAAIIAIILNVAIPEEKGK